MILGIVSLIFLIVGLSIGRTLLVRSLEAKIAQLAEEMHCHEVEFKQLASNAEKLRLEKQRFNNALVYMSEFAREINTDLNREKLAELLLLKVHQMFKARQILVYYTSDEGDRIELEASRGFTEPPHVPETIPMGQGRIGWVAEHQITMSRDDFENQSRVGEIVLDSDACGMRMEMIAPMVHDQKTLGVICVCGAEVPLPEQKKMLKMAADLGSAALRNAQQFREISSSANLDALTKLSNRGHFMEQLGLQVNEAERQRTRLSIFIFDIDHFKCYNDTNGHPAGDDVLRTTGRLLRESLGGDQVAGRYGGEEFIIAMPRTSLAEAREIAERLRETIQRHRFPREESQPEGDLTISGGIAEFPEHGRNIPELISNADKALYRAKANGRNRVEAYLTTLLEAPQETEPVL